MNQCVPSWNLEHLPMNPRMNYEVSELTWENGQPAMHGLGVPRVLNGLLKATPSHAYPKFNNWEKPPSDVEGGSSGGGGGMGDGGGGGGGTLESIVNQATTIPHHETTVSGGGGGGDNIISWYEVPPTSGTVTMTMDALVPCTKSLTNITPSSHVLDILGTCVGDTSARVGSCSGGFAVQVGRTTALDMDASLDWSNTIGTRVTLDTCERELSMAGFASTSLASLENTSLGMPCTNNKAVDDDPDDSVSHGKTQLSGLRGEEGGKMKSTGKESVSTKRSRAAAVHNQSERKRRDKINQRMKTIQKMIPNSSSKTDKASMLDEVIEYLKNLQAHVHMMMSRMNMPHMMMPLAMQQQQHLQMSMMGGPMGIGLPGFGMGMGFMDMNTMGGNTIPMMIPVLPPTAFMQPVAPFNGSGGDRLPSSTPPGLQDPLTAFPASLPQPMTMDAYTRMATMFQQFQQIPGPGAPTTK